MSDIALVATLVIAFLVLISRPVRASRIWSATVTPLASIIGSGFLVSVPLLASAVGIWAVAAVAGLTALAYLIAGLVGEPARAVFLAFAPGGLVEMGLIALSLNMSILYVTAHHLMRIILAVSFVRAFGGRL